MPKIRPDVVSYIILTDRLCKKDKIEKAIDFLHDMISKGHEHDVV
jgi:pentatricopeptide repeat protein